MFCQGVSQNGFPLTSLFSSVVAPAQAIAAGAAPLLAAGSAMQGSWQS